MEIEYIHTTGVIVTYNPNIAELKKNLQSLDGQVQSLVIVDNSENPRFCHDIEKLVKFHESWQYISLKGNQGIATALNVGCDLAIERGATWILTMDQDSFAPQGMVTKYVEYLKGVSLEDFESLGMLTCNMSKWESNIKEDIEGVKMCWTSGALMNAKAYKLVGGFDEKLFIDGVDFDMCAKMIGNGFKIVRINSIILNHSLGKTQSIRFMGKHWFYVTHHNSVRRYYMTRNSLYLNEKYGSSFPELKVTSFSLVKVIFKILIFEQNKGTKIQSIIRGIKDFRKGKYGKFEY